MLNIIDRRSQTTFIRRRNPLPHFLRRKTTIVPDNADNRDINVGQNIRRHFGQDQGRGQQNEQRHDDKSVGAPKSNLNNPHVLITWKRKLDSVTNPCLITTNDPLTIYDDVSLHTCDLNNNKFIVTAGLTSLIELAERLPICQ